MKSSPRRGTAPLEFVMVLPLLFAVVVAGWWCGRATWTKVAAASEARRTAWEKRPDADPGMAFDLRQDPLLSAVEQETVKAVPGGNPFGGGPLNAESFAMMTDKTWDHEEFEFPLLPPSPISAHREQLLHFGEFLPFIARHGPSVAGFADMDLLANGRFTRHLPRAAADSAQRKLTVVSFLYGPVTMGIAIAECAELAAEAWPLIPYYAMLASVIGRGIVPSVALVPESRK